MNELEDYAMSIHWQDALSEFLQRLTTLADKAIEIIDLELEESKKEKERRQSFRQ